MNEGMELKIKRIILGIEAKTVSQYLGVSRTYISLMENDKRKISSDLLHKWRKYLNVTT